MWRIQGQMLPLLIGAKTEAIQISRIKKVGSIAIIKSDDFMPDNLWVLRPLKPAKIVLFQPCKIYCEEYKQIKQNGKRKFVKFNKKQMELFA
jgi:hypothetical protein